AAIGLARAAGEVPLQRNDALRGAEARPQLARVGRLGDEVVRPGAERANNSRFVGPIHERDGIEEAESLATSNGIAETATSHIGQIPINEYEARSIIAENSQ